MERIFEFILAKNPRMLEITSRNMNIEKKIFNFIYLKKCLQKKWDRPKEKKIDRVSSNP